MPREGEIYFNKHAAGGEKGTAVSLGFRWMKEKGYDLSLTLSGSVNDDYFKDSNLYGVGGSRTNTFSFDRDWNYKGESRDLWLSFMGKADYDSAKASAEKTKQQRDAETAGNMDAVEEGLGGIFLSTGKSILNGFGSIGEMFVDAPGKIFDYIGGTNEGAGASAGVAVDQNVQISAEQAQYYAYAKGYNEAKASGMSDKDAAEYGRQSQYEFNAGNRDGGMVDVAGLNLSQADIDLGNKTTEFMMKNVGWDYRSDSKWGTNYTAYNDAFMKQYMKESGIRYIGDSFVKDGKIVSPDILRPQTRDKLINQFSDYISSGYTEGISEDPLIMCATLGIAGFTTMGGGTLLSNAITGGVTNSLTTLMVNPNAKGLDYLNSFAWGAIGSGLSTPFASTAIDIPMAIRLAGSFAVGFGSDSASQIIENFIHGKTWDNNYNPWKAAITGLGFAGGTYISNTATEYWGSRYVEKNTAQLWGNYMNLTTGKTIGVANEAFWYAWNQNQKYLDEYKRILEENKKLEEAVWKYRQ